MSDLRAIVYLSSSKHLLEKPELDHLLARARERNAAEDVTGFLLYCEGSFMQYLEGPRDAVGRIYERIRTDPLHSKIIEIVDEPVAAREFAGWAMAYSAAQMPDFVRLSGAPWTTLASRDRAPRSAQGRLLLRNFWLQHGKAGL